jgi:nitroreductase
MNIFEAIRTKRAVRSYTDQAVPEEHIRQILDAGRRAQSTMNTQPWTFLVVRDRERLKKLSECGDYAGPLSGAAFGIALVSSDEWPFDMGQAAAYLQLAAWELGVGSCLVWLGESEKARELLGVPAGKFLEMAISFGYPVEAAGVKPKPGGRKPFDEVVRWEHW